MGEGKKQMPQNQWNFMDGKDDDTCNIDASSTSSIEHSTVSNGSSSSSSPEMADDASSPSTSCSSSSSSNGALYDLSELMVQLPIKRGLSKFYQGKSQSFTTLSRVTSIEDLPKKESPYKRKIKASKSYGGGLDCYKSYILPKPIISKRASKGSLSSLSFPSRRGSCVNGNCKPPLIPVQKNLVKNSFCDVNCRD